MRYFGFISSSGTAGNQTDSSILLPPSAERQISQGLNIIEDPNFEDVTKWKDRFNYNISNALKSDISLPQAIAQTGYEKSTTLTSVYSQSNVLIDQNKNYLFMAMIYVAASCTGLSYFSWNRVQETAHASIDITDQLQADKFTWVVLNIPGERLLTGGTSTSINPGFSLNQSKASSEGRVIIQNFYVLEI